jgi:hypothetical protein
VEGVPWAKRWERVTHALAQAMALLAKKLSFKEVAEYFELDWKVIATVVKRVVEEGLKLRKVKALHILGIDEVSRKKGHRYLTLLYDLERGRLLWVGLDRKEETLDEFFRWLVKRKTRTLQAICLDMGAPLSGIGSTPCPSSHRGGQKVGSSRGDRFGKNSLHPAQKPLESHPQENRRLSHLLKLNLPIVRAYYLKEEF